MSDANIPSLKSRHCFKGGAELFCSHRRLKVLLTLHHSVSVQWNKRDAHIIQFIKN
jgi:hypothetical protein